ncbi:MAG: hypothetical protein ABI691_04315 [Ginsengibacter sp.]
MKTKFFAALTFLFFIGLGSVNAQTVSTPRAERHRIKQGVKSGELTRAETRNLANQQRDIHQDKKEARADGVVSPAERRHIKKDERKASRSIYRKKHNKRDRG